MTLFHVRDLTQKDHPAYSVPAGELWSHTQMLAYLNATHPGRARFTVSLDHYRATIAFRFTDQGDNMRTFKLSINNGRTTRTERVRAENKEQAWSRGEVLCRAGESVVGCKAI